MKCSGLSDIIGEDPARIETIAFIHLKAIKKAIHHDKEQVYTRTKGHIVPESIKTSISAKLYHTHNVHPQTFHVCGSAFMDAGKFILSHRGKNNTIKPIKE
ncbi:MAG: hypothetical protein OXC46_00430 [Thaumarchaeota archaeon]|nr:hypothetical protein [Nitrososphaerota archaeon]